MNDTLVSKASERRKRLINTYRKTARFGLVLGAGVTMASKVPDYAELACRLLEAATEQPQFTGSRDWARNLVEHQRKRRKGKRETIPPDELILYTRMQLGDDENKLRKLVKRELYKDVAVGVTAGRSVFEDNSSLNAILTFCAARPGSILSPGNSKYEVDVNNKVGGILTTNYDNLIESAFHSKYRRKLLKPVGRPSTDEFERPIPVYHIHGYVSFKADENETEQKENPNIVIGEDDYFKVFYDPLGFGNYIAMSFLRRFPSLFIGSRMTDKNLRRFLFHLYSATKGKIPEHQRKFAILPFENSPTDVFMDEVLSAYGVETIWIDKFDKIPEILRDMYVHSGDETTVETLGNDWENLAHHAWTTKKPK